jgi:ankyrin repeat protein
VRLAVIRVVPKILHRGIPVFLAAGLLVSCDPPERRALRELSKSGIEPSGRALLDAVVAKDSHRVRLLLNVGVFTEQQDLQGRTPVRIAVENGDLASAFHLLDALVDVNATTADKVSVLGVAVDRGETAIVEKLLSAGARTDGLMPDGEKILPWAIRNGRLTFVRAMMKAGADPHLKDHLGSPLLHVAMEAGRRDLMDALIERGADPGATNSAGETTLQIAFRQGWLDATSKLAAAGADPNAPGVDGFTLLERALENRNEKHIRLLLQIGADPNRRPPSAGATTPLERVFKNGDLAQFQIFLDHGVKPPAGNWHPWLWTAYENRHLEAARLLLRQGARATTPGPRGLLLVETAARDGEGSFVKMLTDYGNPTGNSLPQAIARDDRDMVSLLLTCGLPVNVTRIPTRETLLSHTIRMKRDRVAALLVANGADIHLRIPEGQSPLHLAIVTGCHRTVKALLDAGADPDTPFVLPVSPEFIQLVRPGVMRPVLRHDRNFTPLMLAADSGTISTTRHLLQAGAKRNVWTRSYSLWPINFASRRGDVKMMRLILGKDPIREERHIEIRLSEQRARLFDAAGNELFTTQISTGRPGFSTPTGEFVITDKNRTWTSTIYHASMPYFQRLSCSDFGLHQGIVPGYPASHGCIRVPAGNAAKLFTMTEAGDRVRILP